MKRVVLSSLVLVLVVSGGLGALFRQRIASPTPPDPTGPHAAGTFTLAMAMLPADAGRLRPVVEIWVPVGNGANRAPSWPLLLYFPGWPGDKVQNRVLIRDLVSHGFVVAAISYPTPPAALPDMDFSTGEATQRTTLLYESRVREADLDASEVLDELARQAQADTGVLSHRLDLRRVGALGFSWGGSVAIRAYWTEPRIGAALSLDEGYWLDEPQRTDACKVLLVSEASLMPTREALTSRDPAVRNDAEFDLHGGQNMLRQFQLHGGINVRLGSTDHLEFTDAVLATSLRRRLLNPISPRRKLEVIDAHVVTYFQWAFMGGEGPLPRDERARFPEVAVTDYRTAANCPGHAAGRAGSGTP